MGAQFTLPLIEVIPGQLIASALWNNEWNNLNTNFIPAGMDSYSDTDGQMQIQTNPFPGSVTSHATSLGGEIERIRYQISQILGATTPPYWYAAPPTNLTTISNISIPLGGIIDYHAPTISGNNNFLQANGQAIGRSAYAGLFALYNALSPALPFGSGDGSTTFNLPNYSDRMSIGVYGIATAVGAVGGAANTVLVTAQVPLVGLTLTDPGHNHTQNAHNHALTDPQHSHIEQGEFGGTGATQKQILRTSSQGVNGTYAPDDNSAATQSSSTGITLANTTATNNSNTTGITGTAGNNSPNPVETISPYIGMYKLIRVL